MEVTRSNFQEVLEELDSVLEGATFLAIDSEFTGLNSGPEAKAFDTPAQYYNKLRSGSMDFLMVQFGLSVFTYNAESDKYTQRSYNFYVFPRPLNRTAPDCRFMCQASSIAFLADNGFDFNKLFNSGIPYLTTADEERLNKRMEEQQKIREEGLDLIQISDEDKPQIEEICRRIDEFLVSDAVELSIDRCNAFIRRLIHQEARMRWPNKVRLHAKNEGGMQFMVVYKMGTKEEERCKEAERREKEKQEMKNAVGLTLLLRKIADSGKTIVGHNMLLDLCHMIHQFFGPLPESYREFKSLVHGLFPRLLDTKVICKAPQLKEKIPTSVLDAILETVGKEPFSIPDIEPVEGRSYSLASEKYHKAGYDAYVTGLCFIALSNYLGSLEQSNCSTVLCDSPLLHPFLNKLLIIRLKDFPHINLVGNDPMPSRDHVFHMTFPKEWKLSDISQLFTPFGGVYVSWLSDTAAYAVLNKRDQSSSIIKNLLKNNLTKCCTIQTYADYQNSNDETEDKMDRKRKSPLEAVASKKETTKREANSADGADKRVDDVWETVSGKQVKIVSSSVCHQREPIHFENPCLSPTRTDKNTTSSTESLEVEKIVSPPTEDGLDSIWVKETPMYTLLRLTLKLFNDHVIESPGTWENGEEEEDTSDDEEEIKELLGISNLTKKTVTLLEIARLKELLTKEMEKYRRQQDGARTDKNTTSSTERLEVGKFVSPPTELTNDGTWMKRKPKYTLLRLALKQLDHIVVTLGAWENGEVEEDESEDDEEVKGPRDISNLKKKNAGVLKILRLVNEGISEGEKDVSSRSTTTGSAQASKNLTRTPETTPTTSPKTKNNSSSRSSRTHARDEQIVRKRLVASVDDVDGGSDKVELKKPTLKLLRSTKKKSESTFTSSLLISFAQKAFIILILFFILVMLFVLRTNGFLIK